MGVILFVGLALSEIALVMLYVSGWSNKKNCRDFFCVARFAIVVLLLLTGVLEWSFRYVLIVILLLLFAIAAVFSLLFRKEKQSVVRKPRLIGKGIGIILLYFVVLLPAIVFPQYQKPEVTGRYSVKQESTTYIDPDRIESYHEEDGNRSVNVRFWYPDVVGETFPLVIFSHGAYGIKTSNTSTFKELASNGYVVCSIDHPYHSLYTKSETGKVVTVDPKFMQLISDVNTGVYSEAEQIQKMRDVTMIRVRDIEFVIDTVLDGTKHNKTGVYQLVDSDKIGVFGHSLGGAAAVECGRERQDVKAVINLDGDMLCEYLGFQDGVLQIQKAPYPIPLLNIWSDTMIDQMKKEDDQLYPHDYIARTAPVEFDIAMKGTNHFSLTDLSLVSPLLVKVSLGAVHVGDGTTGDAKATLEEMNQTVLHFFNVYLKKEGTFAP